MSADGIVDLNIHYSDLKIKSRFGYLCIFANGMSTSGFKSASEFTVKGLNHFGLINNTLMQGRPKMTSKYHHRYCCFGVVLLFYSGLSQLIS